VAEQRRKRSPIGTAHNNPPTWDYKCTKCGHVYKSPLPLLECRHKCTRTASNSTQMLPVTKEPDED